jgi:SAM-dependent methyltransferase
MSNFQPPPDWEAAYAASPAYFFGEEPSQIARVALSYYRHFECPADGLVLDLGSGEGRDTAFFAEAGLRVVARDLALSGLEKTRLLFARRNLSLERVDLAAGDVREFEYPTAQYDLTLAANVYQFLPPADVPGHLERLQAATKPGGICAVSVFNPAMIAWGAQIGGNFRATGDELMAYFPAEGGWQRLDRTEYWTYRLERDMMASFTYVVARKVVLE